MLYNLCSAWQLEVDDWLPLTFRGVGCGVRRIGSAGYQGVGARQSRSRRAVCAERVRDCRAQGCGSPYSFRLAKNSSRDFFVFNITNITNTASCCLSMRFGGDIMVILVILLGCF